jgi:hypothetical protein
MMTTIVNEQALEAQVAEAQAAELRAKSEAKTARSRARARARAEAKAVRERASEDAKVYKQFNTILDDLLANDLVIQQLRVKRISEAKARILLGPYAMQQAREQICEQPRRERMFSERKQKVIKTEDLEKDTEDICILCLEKHKLKDSIMTSCNHMFGFECFQQFMNSNVNYNKNCPMCRKPDYCLTSFKDIKQPTSKNNTPQPAHEPANEPAHEPANEPKILYRKSKTFFL